MKKAIDPKEVGDALMLLAEILTIEECEIKANELLENIEGRSISVEEARRIREYLNS